MTTDAQRTRAREYTRRWRSRHPNYVQPKQTKHSLHSTWSGMRQRCNDANHASFPYYGGRGISVCSRWDSFESFLADMGDRPEGHTIDRIDNEGNYEPSNCKWSSRSEQYFNRRTL